jgi:hypothetical protein
LGDVALSGDVHRWRQVPLALRQAVAVGRLQARYRTQSRPRAGLDY